MTGLIVFAHGSRVERANEAVRQAARQMQAAAGYAHVEPAFLELGEPDLAGGVARLVEAGVDHVVILPYFLTLGLHMQRDLPALVSAIREAHTNIKVQVAAPLDGHPGLVTALLDRTEEVLNGSRGPAS